ncbi:MAG: polysulfide reductase NrfD [Deltaproteobacteria bacterium]|jgi:molybdopterin-containing oxidoreductase family membrane subunit|nr:polysulfide reductase NrfD [Deltaproteobacteria bacterium]MBW1737432.1 polysulfide reductase NrfD [Deltaproteobacteria bacterium]MBW1908334.1 polysulfide reductase NrfD [Deltaproteobacteria bacterium]MBW2034782.1 polysulfide reductase NrfD [Deltaproteobacteria bacterium]MBW2115024.1 polysulfide reductase NrfD [Deltaproteobacteria bacterium]
MDSPLLPEGVKRCSTKAFFLWTLPWLGLLAWGGLSAFLCLWKGLNQTNMSNIFAFALWIVFDLAVIALGAGAFFTGFLTYIIGKKELKNVINAAVIIGFICYSGAIAMLGIDIGQPIRGWFIFWHANIHSMLVEVSFCITCYLMVLAIEFVPIILGNRQLSKIRELNIFGHNLHETMAVFAATGTFLSFFHQGSLGGMFGVLYARPFAARDGFFIWPWTFFLFILSAIAAGPCFTILCTKLTEKLSRKKLVPDNAIQLLAKISAFLLSLYMVLKIADTLGWIYGVVPRAGLKFIDFYQEGPYGVWLVVCEIIIFGIAPAIILLVPKARQHDGWLIAACLMTCMGIVLNRFVFIVVTLAIPVMPFDRFWGYLPTWQEWGIAMAVIGYGFLLFSAAYRYLPLFPKERELNPVTE